LQRRETGIRSTAPNAVDVVLHDRRRPSLGSTQILTHPAAVSDLDAAVEAGPFRKPRRRL
jgi:hypothetical protein